MRHGLFCFDPHNARKMRRVHVCSASLLGRFRDMRKDITGISRNLNISLVSWTITCSRNPFSSFLKAKSLISPLSLLTPFQNARLSPLSFALLPLLLVIALEETFGYNCYPTCLKPYLHGINDSSCLSFRANYAVLNLDLETGAVGYAANSTPGAEFISNVGK